jgi:glycosyltransferase involved in cell wall biosynthesis
MPIVLDARTATNHFPGIGRYVVNLSQALVSIAPDLGLTLLHDPLAGATRLTLPDLPRIACSTSPFSIQQQWIVPAILRQAQAKLYHSPYYLMPYLPGVPSVVTCYDLIPLIYPEYFSATQRLIYWLAHRLALRTAGLILAISQATKADLVRAFHLDPRRISVTPLAASANLAPCSRMQIDAVRVKYALPEQYVLYLGINKPHKNLARLIQAWQVAKVKYQTPALCAGACVSNIKLVIAGYWDERYPEARRLAEQPGLKDQVVFVGPVIEADLPALYSGATLFVFPSLYEGFGLPVLEAMSCGTPVVCSNTSSLPEVAGDAALLVDPLNIDALAETIGQVATQTEMRQAMREKGLAQAARFSWARTAQETRAAYNNLA